ncbi:MAG: hypothetical protein ACRD1Q_05055, partial [Vicinamibacterales bacterium]
MHPTLRITLRVALLILTVTAAGCAAGAMSRARTAERNDDFDRAVVEYNRILSEDPDNKDARQALDMARLRASQQHFAAGRRLV